MDFKDDPPRRARMLQEPLLIATTKARYTVPCVGGICPPADGHRTARNLMVTVWIILVTEQYQFVYFHLSAPEHTDIHAATSTWAAVGACATIIWRPALFCRALPGEAADPPLYSMRLRGRAGRGVPPWTPTMPVRYSRRAAQRAVKWDKGVGSMSNEDQDALVRDYCLRIEKASADLTGRWREIEAKIGSRDMADLRDIANHSLLVAVAITISTLPLPYRNQFLQTLENNVALVPQAWKTTTPFPSDLTIEVAKQPVESIRRAVLSTN